jgi:hypothetical protein
VGAFLDRKQAKKVKTAISRIRANHKKYVDRADGSIVADSDDEAEYKPMSNILSGGPEIEPLSPLTPKRSRSVSAANSSKSS